MNIDKNRSSSYNDDRKREKIYHILCKGDIALNINKKDIEQYLSEVKEAVENNRYRIERNGRRRDNIQLFEEYIIDEAKAKEILLSLTAMDFSDLLQNEHKGFEHEKQTDRRWPL